MGMELARVLTLLWESLGGSKKEKFMKEMQLTWAAGTGAGVEVGAALVNRAAREKQPSLN